MWNKTRKTENLMRWCERQIRFMWLSPIVLLVGPSFSKMKIFCLGRPSAWSIALPNRIFLIFSSERPLHNTRYQYFIFFLWSLSRDCFGKHKQSTHTHTHIISMNWITLTQSRLFNVDLQSKPINQFTNYLFIISCQDVWYSKRNWTSNIHERTITHNKN